MPVTAPDPVLYGRVTGKFVQFLADSPDTGTQPDELPLTGTVRLEPLVPIVRWPAATPPPGLSSFRCIWVICDG